jgi:hypothetical protein
MRRQPYFRSTRYLRPTPFSVPGPRVFPGNAVVAKAGGYSDRHRYQFRDNAAVHFRTVPAPVARSKARAGKLRYLGPIVFLSLPAAARCRSVPDVPVAVPVDIPTV